MAQRNVNHEMWAGETKVFTFGPAFNEETGVLLDLTSATITLRLRRGSTVIWTKTVGSGLALSNPTGGEFTLTLGASDTSSLSGDYEWEARATLADGTIGTGMVGRLRVFTTGAG